MKNLKCLPLISTLLLTLSACHSSPVKEPAVPALPAARPLTIMPLGDSLTTGIENNGGYRLPLYWLLKEKNFAVDYVGSVSEGPADLPDKDNEGHGGWRIDEVGRDIENKLDQYRPQIILLGAGGNDISQNYHLPEAPQRFLDLVRRIHKHSPKIMLIVQTRPPRTDNKLRRVQKFNARITKLIHDEMAIDPCLFYQDNYAALLAEDIGPDHVHPTVEGNKKLANGWMTALTNALDSKTCF